jgi:YggT family protein
MYAIGKLLEGIFWMVSQVLWLYWWVVLIAVLISWVNPSPYNPIVQFLQRATTPVFAWVRRHVPGMTRLMFQTGFDLSPVIVLLGLTFLRQFVVEGILMTYAVQLQRGARF